MNGHLPEALTRFLGRDREMVEVCARITQHRLVTITGAGGTGKSRLALEVARSLDPAATGVPVLVELAPITDPALVEGLVGAALGLRAAPEGRASVVAALAEHMDGRTGLLLLDNCEHLIDACARLVAALGRYCPGLRVLATSREPLALAGEIVYPIGPLPLPEATADGGLRALERSDAVRLFIDRAQSVDPTFVLDETTAADVADICVCLDGLPLAVELAAARVNVLSPKDIRQRLDDRFAILRSRARDTSVRHGTLRATLDWSYDLLTPAEQTLWRRLAVFVGGFDLAAAEGVAAWDGIAPAAVIDLLGALADKSIVTTVRGAGPARHGMLETLRAYGLDRLVAAGEEEEARSRHSAHYAAMVEGGGTLADPETLAFLLPEEGNLRQALDWTVAAGDGREAALRLAVGLGRMYMDSLRASLALAALDGALSLPGPSIRDVWWATALAMRAGCDFLVHHGAGGTDQAERDLTEALRVARELGERGLESACLNALGGLASARGDVEGLRRRLQEAMPVALAIGDPIPATNLVALLVAEERLQDARAQIERAALAMARASRSPWLETSLALVELSEGRLDAAAAALNRARTSSDPSELLRLSIVSLEACLATLSEDEATALERTAELFAAMARDGTLQGGIGLGAELGILLLARHGQPTLAAELVGRLGNADETPFVAAWRREAEALVVEALGHAGFEAARAAGSVRPHRRIGQDVLSALRAVGDPGEGGHERDARPGDGGSAGDNGTLQTVADRPAARPRPPEAVAAETDGARREEDAALLALTTLSRLSLEECTVVGAYRRYDERVRSELADWRRRMSRPLLEPTLTRENFLVWAAPGSGKSFLVQETARALAGQARYFELNLAREDRDAFVAALARVRGEPSAFLCLLDEIDARADEAWPYEESFSLLDLNLSEERRAVFVLVGSAPGGLAAMVEAMAARPKGRDLLDRVPAGHRFTLPALSLEDRAVIVASQMLDAAAALGRRVREVERFALYYALVETSLASPRQLRDLAVAAVQNLPPDEVRLRYDDLFYRGDSRNQAFWAAHRAAAEALGGRCVRIEA